MNTLAPQPILLQAWATDLLFDLLVLLDRLFQTDRLLQIDLHGTPCILVKSVACEHCGKFFPIYKPLLNYREEPFRCEKCTDICVHSDESCPPIIKTITQYSFRSPKKILGLSIEQLGLLSYAEISVIDQFGKAHSITLKS